MLSTFHSRIMIVHADMSATGLDVEEVSCESKTPKSRTHFCIYQNVSGHICINIRLPSVEILKEGLLTDPYIRRINLFDVKNSISVQIALNKYRGMISLAA